MQYAKLSKEIEDWSALDVIDLTEHLGRVGCINIHTVIVDEVELMNMSAPTPVATTYIEEGWDFHGVFSTRQ